MWQSLQTSILGRMRPFTHPTLITVFSVKTSGSAPGYNKQIYYQNAPYQFK